jgi:predicted nicotinamide N-methyase
VHFSEQILPQPNRPRPRHTKPDAVAQTRTRLLARIHRQFQTITEPIVVGTIPIPFTRIANPNRVLDEICAEEDRREKQTGIRLENPPHLPYWAELWESSRALASALPELDVKNSRVLDLGCGMGLAGAAAAVMGAHVTLVDLESPALLFARLNTLPYASKVRRVNWQIDDLNQRFDLILGADIVYEKAQWNFLEEFWKHHLAPEGSILLAEPHRQSGDLFIDWIQAKHWKIDQPAQIAKVRILRIAPPSSV